MNAIAVGCIESAEPAKLVNVEDIYPMSPLQQGILFHSLYEPASGMYLLELSGHLEAAVDASAFRHAWEHVIRRHAVLRTGFVWEGIPKPMQVVRRSVDLPWHEEDWRGINKTEQEVRWKNFLLTNRKQIFDFKRAPLLRLALIRTGEESYYFLWNSHHILLDGWCWQIVMGEALTLYETYRQKRVPQLKSPRLYRDYIAWLQKQDEKKAELFWREELKGFDSPTALGVEIDSSKLHEGGNEYDIVEFSLTSEQTDQLAKLARDQQVTINTTIQGAWTILLSRYSGEKDVVFGITVSGRSGGEGAFDETVGLFI